jgi:hypothetical protein
MRYLVTLTAANTPVLYVLDGAGLTTARDGATRFSQSTAEWSAANVRSNARFFGLEQYVVTVEAEVAI